MVVFIVVVRINSVLFTYRRSPSVDRAEHSRGYLREPQDLYSLTVFFF
jgi:hypothetical protein